jgi:hypothetical protein
LWAVVAGHDFSIEAGLSQIAAHIIAGDTYKSDVMEDLRVEVARRQPSLRPSMLGKVAIFDVRLTEDAIRSGDQHSIDKSCDELGTAINLALSGTPSDSFLWLARYWLENLQSGFEPDHLRDLRASYVFGPNEAWIAVTRDRYALAAFPELPTDLSEAAISEFVGLVRSGLDSEAVEMVAEAGAALRHSLLGPLSVLPERDRRSFAKALYDRDIYDITVPGIDRPSSRPWQ